MRPFYFKHGVVEFSSKNKVNHYSVSVWDEHGIQLSLIKTGVYNGEDPTTISEGL